ncbi:putative uric acid permease [Rhodococcus sp. AW25M09]|nr:putative uric acid permease [Rhodococcus sp. AW25M09]
MLQMFGYGLQHILSMFGGVIAVPIIVGGAAGLSGSDQALLISCALFISGLATVLQTIGVPFFGSQLPLVQGISFAAVSTMLTIIATAEDGERGLRTVLGAVIVAALIGLAIAPFFSKIVRFFPPIVTGCIITVIGLSLMPVAARWITGQEMIAGEENPNYLDPGNIGLAMFTLLAVLVMTKIPRLSRLSILLGLVVGTIAALIVGKTDFDGVGDASIVAVPTPFAFGSPIFAVGAIISMTIVILVIMVETTADIVAVGEVVGTDVDSKRVGDGLRADMVSSAVAPIFNTFPATAFAQNVGLVAMTGIKSRFVVAVGGGVLAVLGLSPILAAVVGVVPLPVLGGAGIALFGTVAASGIRTLGKVNYDNNSNIVIVAVTIAFGIIPVVAGDFWEEFPSWFVTVFDSGISAASIVAVVLNVFFNVFEPGTPPNPSVVAAGPAVMVREDEARILREGGSLPDDLPTEKGAPDRAAAEKAAAEKDA